MHPKTFSVSRGSRFIRNSKIIFITAAAVCLTVQAWAGSVAISKEILKESGFTGGIVVHVGAEDAELTAGLCSSSKALVHGLTSSAADAEKARNLFAEKGLGSQITVSQLRDGHIPLIDNLVNLLVVSGKDKPVTEKEVLRVLVPGGVALEADGKSFVKYIKPQDPRRDEWTHYLHDADNNAVSHDELVGPPKHMQFRTGPDWTRLHHSLASISALVTSKGRMFYVVDSGPIADIGIEPTWSITARDAYNSKFLWERSIKSWSYHHRHFRSGPVQLPRLLVTDGERVFVPLAIDEPLVALDAATGETVMSYAGTEGTEEIILKNNTLILVTGSPVPAQAIQMLRAEGVEHKKIMAFNADNGKLLWESKKMGPRDIAAATLAADESQVYYMTANGAACLDLKTGKKVWRANGLKRTRRAKPHKKDKEKIPAPDYVNSGRSTLVVKDDIVILTSGAAVIALSAKDGKLLWKDGRSRGFHSPGDLFVIKDEVWTGLSFADGLDLKTGEISRTIPALNSIQTAGHHHRCYRDKATEHYIITGKRGIEFMDLEGDNHARNNWVRGLCQYGIMPANGLVYAPPHSCGCYMEALLYGFWALAAEREGWKINADHGSRIADDRLQKAGVRSQKSGGRSLESEGEWPTLRGNGRRSGSTAMKLPDELKKKWSVKLGENLSSLVVAEGVVLAADVNNKTVFAVDADSGEKKWSFVAGGRIDSPPTIYKGLAIFGCRDGWVYCLTATEGKLVWRFRAAPADYRTVDRDQLESLWPVVGSVLVQDDLVYLCAGRNSYLDEGLFLYALDPQDGNLVARSRMIGQSPKIYDDEEAAKLKRKFPRRKIRQNITDYRTYAASDKSDSFAMYGNMNDLVSGDGENIFLRHMTYDKKWNESDEMKMHLFSTSEFTDGNENHRSHWCYGKGNFRATIYAYAWIPERRKTAVKSPIGTMMAFENDKAWVIAKRPGTLQYRFYEKNIPEYKANGSDYKNDLDVGDKKVRWQANVSTMRPRAILKAADKLVLGGMPITKAAVSLKSLEGKTAGVVRIYNVSDGRKAAEIKIDAPPVWDGMAAANDNLYLSTTDGSIVCLGEE